MKISVVYFSKTGKTAKIAESIIKGIEKINGVEAKGFNLDEIDFDYLAESKAVIFGTPTYYASFAWQIKQFFDEKKFGSLNGKLGGVFSTANFKQGGPDIALLELIGHMLPYGMLVYSSGCANDKPYTHLGPVALGDSLEEDKALFEAYGTRFAKKADELFN